MSPGIDLEKYKPSGEWDLTGEQCFFIYLILKIESSCVCLLFVPVARPQISSDLHEIWHMASLHTTDGHGN